MFKKINARTHHTMELSYGQTKIKIIQLAKKASAPLAPLYSDKSEPGSEATDIVITLLAFYYTVSSQYTDTIKQNTCCEKTSLSGILSAIVVLKTWQQSSGQDKLQYWNPWGRSAAARVVGNAEMTCITGCMGVMKQWHMLSSHQTQGERQSFSWKMQTTPRPVPPPHPPPKTQKTQAVKSCLQCSLTPPWYWPSIQL